MAVGRGLAGVLAAKQASEGNKRRAIEGIINAVRGLGAKAQEERLQEEERRRYDEQMKMKQEQMDWERKTKEDQLRHQKALEYVERNREASQATMERMAKIAQVTGEDPSRGAIRWIENIAKASSEEKAAKRRMDALERASKLEDRLIQREERARKAAESAATVGERKSREELNRQRAKTEAASRPRETSFLERGIRALFGEGVGDVGFGKIQPAGAGVSPTSKYIQEQQGIRAEKNREFKMRMTELDNARAAAKNVVEARAVDRKFVRAELAALDKEAISLDDLAKENPARMEEIAKAAFTDENESLLKRLGTAAENSGDETLAHRIAMMVADLRRARRE